jgi:alanine-glyoxylate transaminase / serine-glyoxylate transaminase / serine-pyruvate transaminase
MDNLSSLLDLVRLVGTSLLPTSWLQESAHWLSTLVRLRSPAFGSLSLFLGYFGDRFADCFEVYGVPTVQVTVATPGDRPSPEAIVEALQREKDIKLVTITHVDTSTGVLMNLKECVRAIRQVNPDVLVAVDGVCALAGEEMRMTDWDIDIYMTGSQKSIGVPPGLSITVVRPRALERFAKLVGEGKNPRSYFASVAKWLPIMKSYEAKQACYFATPAVSLICALNVGYTILLAEGGMERRFQEHKQAATDLRTACAQLGYSFVPLKEEYSAHTMTAIRYPALKEGMDTAAFRNALKDAGIICAGGLHAQIKDEYFRVGHMGLSTREVAHMAKAIAAVRTATAQCARL